MAYITKSYLSEQFQNFAVKISDIFARKTDMATETTNGLMSFNDKKMIDRAVSKLVPSNNSIENNTDLNTIDCIKVGTYYCSSNSVTATLKNCPTEDAFMMEVYSPLSKLYDNETTSPYIYRIRKLITYSGHIYIQHVISDSVIGDFSYGQWFQIYSELDRPQLTWNE